MKAYTSIPENLAGNVWYGCCGHCEGADERDGEESHCASRVYGIEEVGDKNKTRVGYVQSERNE